MTNKPTDTPVHPSNNIVVQPMGERIIHGGEKQEAFFSGDTQHDTEIMAPQRDDKGRFLSGNNGGGRKKGSRNKLTEMFLNTIAEDFEQHGIETLARLRHEDPAMYLKMIAVLLPKTLIKEHEQAPDIDYADMTHEEVVALLEKIQRGKHIRKAIESHIKD